MIEEKVVETLDLSAGFQSLLSRSKAIKEASIDYNVSKVNSQVFRYNPFDDTVNLFSDEKELIQVGISRYALAQLCNKLGVPMRYIDKCIEAKNYELVDYNINDWIDRYKKDFFVRVTDNKIRGLLSSKYSVLDSDEILDIITEEIGDMKVKGSFLSPERLHIRATLPEMLDVPNEDLFAGVQIDSSDVGRSILTCKMFLYKQVCTNGMTVQLGGGILFAQKHIGINSIEFRNEFTENLKNLPILAQQTEELVKINREREIPYSFRKEEDVQKFYQYAKNTFNFAEEHSDKLIEMMNTKYAPTRWGLANSLTEVAQEFTLERRLEIENSAGKLLVA